MIVLNITVVAISLLYILIGRFTNDKNAKYLFAGYRGMSKAEQEKYDIKGIVKFFKPFIFSFSRYICDINRFSS